MDERVGGELHFLRHHEKSDTNTNMADEDPTRSAAAPPPPPPPALAEATDAIQYFTLAGQTCEAKVVCCYDADTIRVVLVLAGELRKFNVRLKGIDTPEKRSKNELERKAARAAHRALLRLLLGSEHYDSALGTLAKLTRKAVRAALGASRRTVTLKCGEFDKYGRLLAELETHGDDATSAQTALVGGGFAKLYDGGTKSPWTDEELTSMFTSPTSATR